MEKSDQCGAACRIVGEGAGVILAMEIEGGFGDIKSDIDEGLVHGSG